VKRLTLNHQWFLLVNKLTRPTYGFSICLEQQPLELIHNHILLKFLELEKLKELRKICKLKLNNSNKKNRLDKNKKRESKLKLPLEKRQIKKRDTKKRKSVKSKLMKMNAKDKLLRKLNKSVRCNCNNNENKKK